MDKIESPINSIDRNNNSYYIIKVEFNNGEVLYPAFIDSNDKHFYEKLQDAINFFSNKYKGEAEIETVIDNKIFNYFDVRNWDEVREEIFSEDTKIGQHLKEINELGMSSFLIDLIKKDLDVENNKKLFEAYLELSDFSEEEKEKIILAMNIAIEAHKGQTQKRPQDKEGLDNIPYSNHPIRVATFALKDMQMSSDAIQAALLHDVIEDTDIDVYGTTLKIGELEGDFGENVLRIVNDCSKEEGQSREEFIEKVRSLSGDSKIIKCIDRLHNIIRIFSVKDVNYISRYLEETKEIYLPAFEKMPELLPLRNLFYDLLEQMELYLSKINNGK